jgi:putative FmdB family regulatory protein
MPVYEYYCRSCETTFEKLRPISASNQAAECPSGHTGATRTLSLIATITRGGATEAVPAAVGGCCGGGCACGGGGLN